MPSSDFLWGQNTFFLYFFLGWRRPNLNTGLVFFRFFSFFFASRHCTAVLFSQVLKKCTDLKLSLLHILISGTYGKFARKNNFLALGVCFPQPCSSAGAGLLRQDYVYITTDELFRFHNNELDEMPCKLDSTENLRPFENTQPHLHRIFLLFFRNGLIRNLSLSLILAAVSVKITKQDSTSLGTKDWRTNKSLCALEFEWLGFMNALHAELLCTKNEQFKRNSKIKSSIIIWKN